MIKIYFFLVLIVIWGCNTTQREINTDLLGVVYDYQNNPLANASITFKADEREYIGNTDIHGKFIIEKLPFGNYKVIGTLEGYGEANTTMLHRGGEIIIIRIPSYSDLISSLRSHLIKGNLKIAEEKIIEIEGIDSKAIYYQYLLGIYHLKSNRIKKAEEIFLNLYNARIDSAYIALVLGDIYEHKLKDKKKAIYYLERFLDHEYTQIEDERLGRLKNEVK